MIHFLGLACVVFGLVLCTYYLVLLIRRSREKNLICIDEKNAVEIVKLLEALREVCPPGAGRGWTLLSNSIGLRCWWRKLPFKFLNFKINIYASSTVIKAPAVSVLNVIADISTWPEWDPSFQQRHVEAELSDDPDLHGDKYMQCDQVVTMTLGQMPKPGILMYRFGNLENNGVGWVLLWHIRRLDWTFFLAQPIEESSQVEDKNGCLVTMVRGYNPFQKPREDLPNQLAFKLGNLKDAVELSRFKFRPLLPVLSVPSHTLENPHLPTIHSALLDLSEKPCVLLRSENYRDRTSVLAAVPFADAKPISLQNMKGYVLVPWHSSETVVDGGDVPPKGSERPRRRSSRASKSVGRGDSFKKEGAAKQCSPAPAAKSPTSSSSSSSSPVSNRKNKVQSLSAARLFSHLFRRRSSELSALAVTDEECNRTVRRNSSSTVLNSLLQKPTLLDLDLASQHPLDPPTANGDKSDVVQDTFLLVPDFPARLNGDKYKSVGRKCASQVIKEVLKASAIDVTVPHHDQRKLTGGWVCEGVHKDVLVLMKLSTEGSLKTVSYLSKGVIPASPLVIWKAICNPMTRFMYDETVKHISIVQELSSEQKIVYTYHESVSLLKKEAQDFCLLHTQSTAGLNYLLTAQSVEHGSCPTEKEAIRGVLLPSGWIIEPLPENKTHSVVTYLIQVTVQNTDSLLVEEMGTTQCVSNLRSYLIASPKRL